MQEPMRIQYNYSHLQPASWSYTSLYTDRPRKSPVGLLSSHLSTAVNRDVYALNFIYNTCIYFVRAEWFSHNSTKSIEETFPVVRISAQVE